MSLQKKTRKAKLGSGTFYFDPNGGREFREIADTPNLTVQVETEVVQRRDADSQTAELSDEAVVQADRTLQFESRDVTLENMAMFFVGEETSHSQSSADGESETIEDVSYGRVYSIGSDEGNRSGVRKISNVTVTDDGGADTYDEGDDYEIDTDNGLIQILEDGDISEGDDIEVEYDADGVDWDQVEADDVAEVEGVGLFVADNTKGENVNYIFTKLSLRPSGDFAMKSREDWQVLSFKGTILTPAGEPAMIADGEPYSP